MAHVAIRHRVRDYAAWKQVFDEHAPQRRAAGEISYAIYRNEDDRNDIALMFEWNTLKNPRPSWRRILSEKQWGGLVLKVIREWYS